jgi:hypothetical protein
MRNKKTKKNSIFQKLKMTRINNKPSLNFFFFWQPHISIKPNNFLSSNTEFKETPD